MAKILLVLLALTAYATADLCSSVFDGVDIGPDCACFSGHTGLDCSSFNSITCAFPTVLPLNTTIVAELSNYHVANDYLTFDVLSDGFSDRYFDEISLSGNSSCTWPSTLSIVKGFLDSPDCMDVYSANFSIPDIVGCGFSSTNNGTLQIIAGSIHVSANDNLGLFRNITLSRNTRSVLNIEILIPTQIFVNTSTPLTVFSAIQPTYAVTSQIFDPLADTITIVLTTSVQWPYQLTSPSAEGIPGVTDPASIADSSFGCSQTTGNCFQDTTVTFSGITQGGSPQCDISGAYTFSWNYNCRSGQAVCPVDGTGFETATANIITDNPCAVVTVAAHISGTLQSYPDNTFGNQQLVFVANQQIFFLATFTSDVTIQSMTVEDLTVTQGRSIAFLVSGGVVQPIGNFAAYGLDTVGADEVGFHFTALTGPGGLNFIFDSTIPDSVYTFTVEATFTIAYKTTFGRKRDIVTESLSFKQRGVLDASSIMNAAADAGLDMQPNSGYKAAATVLPIVFAAAAAGANL